MSPMLAAHSVCLFTTWGYLIRRQTMDEIEWADETCNPLRLHPKVQTLAAAVR
jgi:hypothetical protein